MRHTRLLVRIQTDELPDALWRIADFERYPLLADDVRAVGVHPAPSPDLPRDSDWEVNFRRGVMRWNEWESIDIDRLRIEFEQTDGDFAEFSGCWQLQPQPGGADVLFDVTYDFGIESLAGIMDPIAERVITRVVCSVLAELFGETTILDGGQALADLPGLSPSAPPWARPPGGGS
jgi:ribosome-associated toxin RatA of RatAB toxin-antitoxin module